MYTLLQVSLLILMFKCSCIYSGFHESNYVDNRINYDFVSPDFEPLERRFKRGIDDDDDSNIEGDFQVPSDVEIQNDTVDHKYYVLETFTNRSDMIKDHYFDVKAMLKKPGTIGNTSHPLLSNSYRRAVAAKMQFEFPFYGHKMKNLTIATGGFSYVGDQSHSWLAATQYIAPLMANFDTRGSNSTIMYADDGEKFVIEWKNLQLRLQRTDGYFTFQVSLHKSGDIWFVYKDIPIPVMNISDSHHPVKIGMSDAYLYYHKILLPHDQPPITKRVIYEYHRIEINPATVTSNTVIRLVAQPTCVQYNTCDECSNATLKHFNCSWCHSKQANGGPFCSDSAGLHRRRQQWLDANCKNIGKVTYCNARDDFNEVEETEVTANTPKDAAQSPLPSSSAEPDQVISLDQDKEKAPDSKAESQGSPNAPSGSYSWMLVILGILVLTICWLGYAYMNPHTPSGQFLIRYRPSQWRMPSSHVRYSASMHM